MEVEEEEEEEGQGVTREGRDGVYHNDLFICYVVVLDKP